jgi:uncharacterized protein DUF2341
MAKEAGSNGLTAKLVLACACMALLVFSVPAYVNMMNAFAQNSTSTDTSSGDDSSDSQSQEEASSSPASSEGAEDNNENMTSSESSEADSNSSQESRNETSTTSDSSADASQDSSADGSAGQSEEQQQSNNSTDTSSEEDTSGGNSNNTSSETEELPSDENSNVQPSSQTSDAANSPDNATNTSTAIADDNSTQQQQAIQNTTSISVVTNTTITEVVPAQNATTLVTISGEPLLPSSTSITRTFSSLLLKFEDEDTVSLRGTIIWNTDGTVKISDDRGFEYSLTIPIPSNGTSVLLSNSTIVDQKFISDELQFDLYWTGVTNADGIITKYKFTIAGTSVKENSKLTIELDGGQYVSISNDQFVVEQPNKSASALADNEMKLDPSLDWTPIALKEQNINTSPQDLLIGADNGGPNPGGLGLDWSDAIGSGYNIDFNPTTSSIQIPVGKSFVIDPTTVASIILNVSPSTTESSEGETRVVQVAGKLFAFFYDGSNILYRASTDNGYTWTSSISLGTGVVASDYHRWAVAATSKSGSDYIDVLYWTPSGTNMNFYSLRGTITGSTETWNSPVLLGFTSANSGACGSGGACAAAVASTDTNGNIFAAFTWLSGGATQYAYQIMSSTDGGLSWSTSLSQVYPVSTSKPTMVLTKLDSGKMLFAYTNYDMSNFKYRVYSGSTWGAEQTTLSGSGMSISTLKQISASSNSTNYAFVTYLTGGTSGTLKVARFSNTGSFQAYETADSTLSHTLPSMVKSGTDNIMRVYTLSNNKIYETKRISEIWQAPVPLFSACMPDQLTAAVAYPGGLLREGNANPYALRFVSSIASSGSVCIETTSAALSPLSSDYYEGERRVANIGGNLFAFYYNGSSIVYKSSADNGRTWSAATSAGTGSLSNEFLRFTIGITKVGSTKYVNIFYYTQSGSNTNFYSKAFSVSGTTLTLQATTTLLTVANDASCSPTGVCSATTAAADTSGNLFVAFSYKTGGTFNTQVFKSTNGGQTWSNSMTARSLTTTGPRVPVTITNLASGKMLLTYAKYDSASLFYAVFSGSSWGTTQTLSGTGMSTSTIKQISSATNSTGNAFVTYVTGGVSGTLKVVKFSTTGTLPTFETADSSLSHALPSITISSNATGSAVVRIYSIASGKIYETKRDGNVWASPSNPFGNITISANKLTAGLNDTSAVWREGSASPYNIMFGRDALTIADDYRNLVSQLDNTGLTLAQTTVTSQLITDINSTLTKLKNDVISLQNLGFEGDASGARVGQKLVGTVGFYDKISHATIVNSTIPDGTLGVMGVMGFILENNRFNITFSFNQTAAMLKANQALVRVLPMQANISLAEDFVLGSIYEYHPSTGNSFLTDFQQQFSTGTGGLGSRIGIIISLVLGTCEEIFQLDCFGELVNEFATLGQDVSHEFQSRVHPINIHNSGSALTDYQIPITLDTASFVTEGKLYSDCSNLRFDDNVFATVDMKYWIESGCNTSNTLVWIRVPTIPTGDRTIYMTFNPLNIVSASSGFETFPFFEDFGGPFNFVNPSVWTEDLNGVNCGNTVANGVVSIKTSTGTSDCGITSNTAFGTSLALRTSAKIVAADNNWLGFSVGPDVGTNPFVLIDRLSGTEKLWNCNGCTGTVSQVTIGTCENQFCTWDLIRDTSKSLAKFNTNSYVTNTGSYSTASMHIAVGGKTASANTMQVDWIALRQQASISPNVTLIVV